MNEHNDKKLAELFKAARSTPRPGWEPRAITAMLNARSIRSAPRFRTFAVAVEVMLVIFALGLAPFSKSSPIIGTSNAMAAQIAMADTTPQRSPVDIAQEQAVEDMYYEAGYPIVRSLEKYRQRAAKFVRDHYPNDPDMLMAAGLLTRDAKEGQSLFIAATSKSKKPAVWAAYAGNLFMDAPGYMRPGTQGIDPEDTEKMAQWQKTLQESPNTPATLSEDQAAPFLQALRGWEAVDPQNALPVALQVNILYGLHKDTEALATWKRAGNLPIVEVYIQEKARAVARLLNRMGMGEAEAVFAGSSVTSFFQHFAVLRSCARIASYEGRLAQIQGRSKEAIEWWNGSINVGYHMQESSDTMIGCLVGMAIEAIGTAPTWKWHRDIYNQASQSPLNGGSIYYGRQHAFYVSQVGEQADLQVRDRLVLGQVRKLLAMKYNNSSQEQSFDPLRRSNMLLVFSRLAALFLVVFAAIFAAISLRARSAADEAANLRLWARIVIILLILLPLLAAGMFVWKAIFQAEHPHFSYWPFVGGLAISLAVLLIFPLISALLSRRSSARVITTWRGNLRKLLPAAIVLCALISLGLGISGRIVRSNYIKEWYSPGYSEMAQLKQFIGPEWNNPKIPAGAWHAEYPPKRP